MLTRFAVDPEALASARLPEHQRLLKAWQSYGVLIHNSPMVSESDLADVINSLPQAPRIMWQKLLGKQKKAWLRPSHESWMGVNALHDHPENASLAAKDIDLICMEEDWLELLHDELHQAAPNIELGELRDIDTTKAFEQSELLANKPIESMQTSRIWAERFESIASMAKNITIVDRYALSYRERNGLETFLVLLDGAARKANVTIFSAYGSRKEDVSRPDAISRLEAMSERLSRGGVGSLKLHLAPARAFGGAAHDRFVKFDHLVVEIGSGMAIFEGKDSLFSSKPQMDEHRHIISNLLRLSSSKPDFEL